MIIANIYNSPAGNSQPGLLTSGDREPIVLQSCFFHISAALTTRKSFTEN